MVWRWVGLQDDQHGGIYRAIITPEGELSVFATPETIDPAATLSASTTLGPGEPLMLSRPARGVTIMVQVTGNPTNFEIALEVTPNGTDWFVTSTSITTSGFAATEDAIALGYRANLISMEGGTSPAVSVYLVASY